MATVFQSWDAAWRGVRPHLMASRSSIIGHHYRSSDDRWIAGVCGGLAARYNLSAGGMRLLFLVLLFFTGGQFVWFYLLLILLRPVPSNTIRALAHRASLGLSAEIASLGAGLPVNSVSARLDGLDRAHRMGLVPADDYERRRRELLWEFDRRDAFDALELALERRELTVAEYRARRARLLVQTG